MQNITKLTAKTNQKNNSNKKCISILFHEQMMMAGSQLSAIKNEIVNPELLYLSDSVALLDKIIEDIEALRMTTTAAKKYYDQINE